MGFPLPRPAAYSEPTPTTNNYKKQDPHTLQATTNQTAAFPFSRSQVPLPTRPASPHTRTGSWTRSGQEFSTNFRNVRIASRRWSAWRGFGSLTHLVAGGRHCNLGERVSREPPHPKHPLLVSLVGKCGEPEPGGREGGQGPRQGDSVPLGISPGPALIPVLRVSPNLEAGTLSGIPKVVRDRLESSCRRSPSHKGFIFFSLSPPHSLIADVLIKPSNSCYAVLKGTYSSVNQAGLGGGSVGRRIKGRLTNHSGDHNNKIRGKKITLRLFVERREQAASGRQPCAAADTKSAGDSARLIYDVLQPYKSCSDEASAPTTAGRFSLINKT